MARAATRAQHERFTPARGVADADLGSDQAIVGGFDGEPTEVVIGPEGGDELSEQIAREEQENKDWDLPPEERGKDAPRREERQERQERQERREQPAGEGGDDDEEMRLAYDESERGYEERRGGRRSRRNRARKEAITGRDQEIEQLKGQLNGLGEFVQRLTGGQMGLAARDLEARITYARNAIDLANNELARAVKEADGDAYARITQARDEAQRELWALEGQQQSLQETARRTFSGGGRAEERQQQQQPQLSPDQQRELARREAEASRFSEVFRDRYSWFDPERSTADNDVVMEIDQELISEGYLPHTKAFWHQMEARMREEGYRPNEDDEEEERPRRRERVNGGGGGRPPTSVARGGRRPGGGRGGFNLDEQQTNLLRDEGLLEQNLSEQDLARRDRIIGKWRVGAERLRRAGLDR